TYKEMYYSIDNLWSVLFTTGYLRLPATSLFSKIGTMPLSGAKSKYESNISDLFFIKKQP
ncbi:hypothetical protein, partial [Alistipes ihumii]|uniref:hypothetical protein n=1 Tax=Alistipes ihumii TaxID=1470347 RepID=UPI003AB5C339